MNFLLLANNSKSLTILDTLLKSPKKPLVMECIVLPTSCQTTTNAPGLCIVQGQVT